MQVRDAGAPQVISFHYTLYDEDSDQVESSEGGDPITFLWGERRVLAALQGAFPGRDEGESFTVTIPAERAYGRRYPDRVQRVALKHVRRRPKRALRRGDVIDFDDAGVPRSARVLKAGRFNVDVDLNHPLAGQDLTFSLRIVAVRDATAEEIAHGHAHGPGGHRH